MTFKKIFITGILMAGTSFLTAGTAVSPGVSDSEIRLTQIAAQSGPAAFLGTQMRLGLTAGLGNMLKGADGKERKIILDILDDMYEEAIAGQLAGKTLGEDKTLALIGGVGTPTAKVISPQARGKKVPMFGWFTGAGLLREAGDKIVSNLRASYMQEAQKMIDLAKSIKTEDSVGVFMQKDSFGEAVLKGVTTSLVKEQKAPVVVTTFERNTVDIAKGLDELLAKAPKVIVMVGPYKPIAAIVKAIKTDPKYAAIKDSKLMTVSFVGSDALAKELGKDGEGVIVTQVVPDPFDTKIPLVAEYQAAVKGVCQTNTDLKSICDTSSINWVSIEGYIVGKLTRLALEKMIASGKLSRESFNDALRSLDVDLGGFKVKFNDTQASDMVTTTMLKDGRFVAINKLS